MSYWFKFYGQDFLTDPKMMKLNSIQKLMWIGLLCIASGRDSEEIKFLTEDNLKLLTKFDPTQEEWAMADNSFKRFIDLRMIKMPDADTIVVLNFIKRQEAHATGAERVARCRAKKEESYKCNTDSVTDVTSNRIEEKRIEKNIYTSIDSIKNITDNDVKELMEKYSVSRKCVLDRCEDVVNYCEAKGKKYSNYKAALRNFIKSHIEKHPDCIVVHKDPPKFEPPIVRTPEEQANLEKKMAEIRKNLKYNLKMEK